MKLRDSGEAAVLSRAYGKPALPWDLSSSISSFGYYTSMVTRHFPC